VGATFFAPVQTGLGVHPASYTMGTGSFPEVKRPGPGVENPPPSSAEVKEKVELYLYSTFGPSWPVTGQTLTLLYSFLLEFDSTPGPRCDRKDYAKEKFQ